MSGLRIRAPELTGRGWLNTGRQGLDLASLRGKIVLLDFWTFCCVNCLHVIEEIRPLEAEFTDALVVVGVHSPKFEHEAEPAALAAAVERYAVHHAVLDDPELTTWKAYTARAWPTVVVIDPDGYIVASMSGEGHAVGLRVLLAELVAQHEAAGTLRRGNAPYVAPHPTPAALRFPGKVAALPDGSFLVSDTAHHQLVHLDPDLQSERRRYGELADGSSLAAPQGILVLPPETAGRVGYDVVVADSVRHQIFGVRLDDGTVTTLAGTGEQLRERAGSGRARAQQLSSPWDMAWYIDRVVIAMAGTHQLWALNLATDPDDNTVAVLAGTSQEGLHDGPAHDAWFAQPSGLATSADGSIVWVADSETSALRSITLNESGFEVQTHIGEGLFGFGLRDGDAAQALLQHPLGVTVLPDASVAISDTYNGAIRRYDPATGQVTTVATGLVEPSDLAVEVDGTDVRLVVVESGAHRLVRIALPEVPSRQDGAAMHTHRPPTPLSSGAIQLTVRFAPPTGQNLDDRYGDPTRLSVSATPPGLLLDGGGRSSGLTRLVRLDPDVHKGVLHVSVQAAACDGGEAVETPEHAACHLYQQDWGIPVRVSDGAGSDLVLDLRAT